MNLGLSGKRALVLGASRGLGGACAKGLVVEGAAVLAVARSLGAPAAWSEGLAQEARDRLSWRSCDMGRREEVEALAAAVVADGGVDILINNGGGPPPGAALDVTPDQWTASFEAMATHLFLLAQRLVPGMIERGFGRVLTIASSGVEQPIPNLALSNGVRAAVIGWSKTLASEVAARGVTVNVVLPGRIHTDRVDQLDAAAAVRQGRSVEEVATASRATIPASRYGAPEEFADVVTFLASPRASYVTGAKIRVDGGLIRSL